LRLQNVMSFAVKEGDGVDLEVEGVDAEQLRRDGPKLIASVIAATYASWGQASPGIRVHVRNEVPVGKGLGGSATAIVASILGSAALAGRVLSATEVLALALPFEGHPDNITPALVGGLTISRVEGGQVRFIRLPPPRLSAVLCVPDDPLSTELARSVVPAEVPLVDAVYNLRSIAFLLAGLSSHAYDELPGAMQDRLHEPYRRGLLPALEPMERAALSAGALGAALSGAGSSVFAFVRSGQEDAVGSAMLRALESAGGSGRVIISGLQSRGATVSAGSAP
jgi:homoserine kinase